jgi:5-hydroxyisourate hydrolase-like protein (transthyretin family)
LAYLDGEVSKAERAQIEQHLAQCPDCAAELDRLQALQADLSNAIPAGLAQLRLPESADARIRARLRQERQRRSFGKRWLNLLRPRPALIKAAIPLLVVLFILFAALVGPLATPVSAQETLIVAPATLAPGTEASLRVIVREVATARPLPGAEIYVRLRPHGQREAVTLYSGRTGPQGTADVRFHVPDYGPDSLSADLIVATASTLGAAQVERPVTVRRSFRVYLTSDKPIYRPGQALHMRALALEASTGLPASGREVRFAVESPGGGRLFAQTLRTSAYGIAAADYALPVDAAHGAYRLAVTMGDTLSQRTVSVGPYETPRFRVELGAERGYYLPGEVVGGTVIARTFAGQPLPAVQVALRAYLDDPERRLVATVQGRTDAQGAVAFRFGLPADLKAAQATLALEASVTDAAGHVEWAGHVVPVAAESLIVDVVPEGGRLRPGVENVLYVLSATPDGAPAPAQLTVSVEGQQYSLATDAYGLAEVRLVPAARDVQVQVTARDAAGREAAKTIPLAADQGPAQVLLRLDRAAYEVGETMQAQVYTGQGGIVYLDVVRQGQTLSTHVLELGDGKAELALDVSSQMAGTLELHAYQVLADGTLARDTRLAVVDAPDPVTVGIRLDKATFLPGDTAHVTIDTAVDGAPVRSAVGVAVVDESVFALEDRAPGFAKLFFLLEASLLAPEVRPLGAPLDELLDPADPAAVRAAQNVAARAAWADLPAAELDLTRSVGQARCNALVKCIAPGSLGAILIAIPLALWGFVLKRLRRAGSLKPAVRRAAVLLLALILVAPVWVAGLMGAVALFGVALGKVLLGALVLLWFGVLFLVGLDARRKRDDDMQVIVLLILAYGVLGALLGYMAERGGGPAWFLCLIIAIAFGALLLALTLLSGGLWVEKKHGAGGGILALLVLLIAIVALAGMAFETASPLARMLANPNLCAGPMGWLSGCAPMARPEVVEKEVELTQVAEVEKEVAKEVETVATPTPEPAEPIAKPTATPPPQPTPTAVPTRPPATATPAPAAEATRRPTPLPEAVATVTPGPPPPLLGQFMPETIYWAPEAVTDEAGHLELHIPLPDSPATWRLTALASTRRGQLGTGTALLHVGE